MGALSFNEMEIDALGEMMKSASEHQRQQCLPF